MKTAILALFVVGMTSFLMSQYGCSTDQPGAEYTLGNYSTNLDGATDKVTAAAGKACEDMKLTNIVATGTKIDGKVTAKNAEGNDVTITIEQSGDTVSKVTVRVGATGDEAASRELVDRIKSHL